MSKTPAPPAPAQQSVLVLGMHRSGTSALAGLLSLIGCATPASLIQGDENNKKGYFESNAIGRLSDALFEARGTAWNDWVPLELGALSDEQQQDFHDKACQVIADDFADTSPFVLKEPRMCRMMPFWQDVLEQSGCAVRIVHTHRNPQEVAASLARRDGFEPAFSLLVWLRHVLEAESATRGLPRVFTSYRQLMTNWQEVVEKLEETHGLGLSFKTSKKVKTANTFLSDQLQHFSDTTAETLANPAMPVNVRDTFAIMERWADAGEQDADHTRLDELRSELDTLALAFGPVVRPGQMAMLEVVGLKEQVAAMRAELVDADSKDQALEELSRKIDQLRAEESTQRALQEAELFRLQRDVLAREQTLEALSRAINHLRAN